MLKIGALVCCVVPGNHGWVTCWRDVIAFDDESVVVINENWNFMHGTSPVLILPRAQVHPDIPQANEWIKAN
jgi:hypothetical protein